MSYADENLEMCELALEHGHLNACLQNAQQAAEKYLKAVIVERGLKLRRTHSIRELVGILADQEIAMDISQEEMDLLDAIYMPSKYPDYSALPDAGADEGMCREASGIARKVRQDIRGAMGEPGGE